MKKKGGGELHFFPVKYAYYLWNITVLFSTKITINKRKLRSVTGTIYMYVLNKDWFIQCEYYYGYRSQKSLISVYDF